MRFLITCCVFRAKFHFRCRVFEVAGTAPTAHSTPPTHQTMKYMYGTDSSSVGNGIGARVGWYDGCCEKDGGFVAYVGATDGLCVVGVAVLGSGVA